MMFSFSETVFPIARSLNLVSDESFEGGTTEWTLAGSGAPARSNTRANTGTWSLLYAPSAGQGSKASLNALRILPNQFITIAFYRWSLIAANNNNIAVRAIFYDTDGNVISQPAFAWYDDVDWELTAARFLAPTASNTVVVEIEAVSWSGTGSQVYVDDVNVEIY
jgi:hypothetical protein